MSPSFAEKAIFYQTVLEHFNLVHAHKPLLRLTVPKIRAALSFPFSLPFG